MNINQINFVQKIIDNVVEQGEIDLESLADGRPPFDRPQKFFDLFAENEQETLISIIRNINENAEELIAA